MTAPTAPTSTTICTEGLKKSGYSSPTSAQLTRAADWLEEIKVDIFLLGKRLKPLQAEHVEVLNPGQSRYNFPSGFSSMMDAKVLYGDEEFTAQTGAAATITLDADDTENESSLEGKEILVYSGTGKGDLSQCKSYNETTFVATVSPAWLVTPLTADTYVVVDQYIPLELRSVAEFDEISVPHETGVPRFLYQVGSETHYGYYLLYPTPDEDHYYGIKLNYYINLLTLDLAGTRMTTLYQRWRNMWIQGVKARQLDSDNDDRAGIEMQLYYNMVKNIVTLETYGRDIKPHYTGVRA